LPAFSVTVENLTPNEPPQIGGMPPPTATVDQEYLFLPDSSDPDAADTLTFSIVNRPSWASFNTTTGRLRGTPVGGDEGVYSDIRISVSDGDMSADLPAFSVTVENLSPNTPPQISGTPPPTATVDQQYLFLPNASDTDGDNLTFSIVNRPAWASFDATTGQLSGTPVQGEEGVYDNIEISVSDADSTASLPLFAITVAQAATGSVTLTWTPPTKNTDGSPLTDLIAYKIYYGLTQGNYPNEIRIDNPGISTYVIDNLNPNTYYFVATSINSTEIESNFSNEALKIVVAN